MYFNMGRDIWNFGLFRCMDRPSVNNRVDFCLVMVAVAVRNWAGPAPAVCRLGISILAGMEAV